MNPDDLFTAFMKLDEGEQNEFLHMLSSWMTFRLPEGKYIMLTLEEYTRLQLLEDLKRSLKHLNELANE